MQEEEADGALHEIQNAGAFHTDGQEAVEDCEHQQEHTTALSKRQDREQETDADDRYIPQLPQPQLRFGL